MVAENVVEYGKTKKENGHDLYSNDESGTG
jgi:hypothetical protein